MSIRTATHADSDLVRELYEEFNVSMEGEPDWMRETWEEQREAAERRLAAGDVIVLEEEGEVLAFAVIELDSRYVGMVHVLYSRPHARRRGHARTLLREVATRFRERGATYAVLDVLDGNVPARALYERLGFKRVYTGLATEIDRLEARLATPDLGDSYGSLHVQTDDAVAVERAVTQFMPRIGKTEGSIVTGPRNGWVAVYDELTDRDPKALRRLARELAERMGAVVLLLGVEEGAVVRFVLLERGSVMDEYLSVQEYYGSLPPGEVVALAANPRVVSRLTGAHPEAVRAATLHGKSPSELPPAPELLASIAAAIGVEGGDVGYRHVAAE